MRSDDGSFSGDTFGKAPNSLPLSPAVFAALRRCPRPLPVPALISFRGNRQFFPAIFCRPLRLRVIAVLKCFTVLKKLKRGTLGQFGGKQCLYEISVGCFVMTVGWFSSSLCGNNSVYRTCSITNITAIIYNLKLIKDAVGFTIYNMHISYLE